LSFLGDPRVREALISLAVLLGSYVAARFVSYLLGKLLERTTRRTATDLDDRLLSALKRPITYLLFGGGAWVAVHRLPAPAGVIRRLDAALFVGGVVLVTLALMRAYAILLAWYTAPSRFGEGDGMAAEFGPLLKRIGQIFLAVVAVIAILQRMGVNVASLVVSLGVGSLAVGLAAQDTLANMFAGFALMLDRPFRIGDRIQLASGEVGDVEQVGMRATRIRTVDDTLLVVPNSLLVKERVVNQARPTRAVVSRIELGVAYGSDLPRVRTVLTEAALAVPQVERERPPVVLFTKFADSAITCRLVFFAKDYIEQGLAVSGVYEEIERRFRDAGIAIPYPTRRIIQEGAAAPDEV
jgi:MscS family membrane protein